MGVVTDSAARPAPEHQHGMQPGVPPPNKMPARVFFIEMSYLIILIALLIIYIADDSIRDVVPALGPLPMQIVWFGAIGAVLAGISGIYFHNQNWNHSYDYWHYSRPFVGAVVGGIGCLLFYVSILLGSTKSIEPNAVTFDAAAFILGYADDAFRSLIAKLTQLLFAPGNGEPPGPKGA